MPDVAFSALTIFIVCIIAFMGACLGSFSTAIAYRVANHKSWILDKGEAARSMCPACGHRLGWRDLIPVFSWLVQKGKCRYCAAPICKLYPVTEMLGAITLPLMVMAQGISMESAVFFVLLPFWLSNIQMAVRAATIPARYACGVGCGLFLLGGMIQGQQEESLILVLAVSTAPLVIFEMLAWRQAKQEPEKIGPLSLSRSGVWATVGTLFLCHVAGGNELIYAGALSIALGAGFRLWRLKEGVNKTSKSEITRRILTMAALVSFDFILIWMLWEKFNADVYEAFAIAL
ncbi:MAG: prepilin peptidase [Pseudobdellovibrionaceae bacterium]